ncbi:protein ERGIC-53-like isoform X4 [Canis lupus dingo]|uniref:protein ERGIC-53-like isoform X4 n=1 Tax=Canis lupus dingo TaxID=286419 RepID=UPI0002747B21|nr:protein ERGIC-53-like isoform X4 [Canis lupus dingo]|eukprot:XP_005638685.1 protein ERGIC-53-like isoform X4 [Canis lupus familiaris]
MLVASGEPLLRLALALLLLLGAPGPEGASSLQRRFEYKLSFKGPRLAAPGAAIPFWSHHGGAVLGPEEVRLAPSTQSLSGAVWSRAPVLFSAWEVEVQMRVTGPGRLGAQGMQSPVIRVLASDGHTRLESHGDGAGGELGSCRWDFRNLPRPFTARITYWGHRLRVSLSSGLTPSDLDEVCVDTGPLLLAPGGFFGVSAATSTLADDHDILSFLTFSLSEPGPKPPRQPLLEMEERRLARQLEGLRARLALGTREDAMPKLSSKVQEEGERRFGLEETLGRYRQILQALQGLSKRLAQAERQWKMQLGSLGHARPVGAWDSAKVCALLHRQRTLLQDLQEIRDAAARVASRAQLFYLPVGTKHHFLELAQILSLLQKDVQGPLKAAAKPPCSPRQAPGASSCLQPGIFLLFLLIQTLGFFCYEYFRWELDKSLQDCLSTGSHQCPAPHVPGALGVLRREPLSPSMRARLT